MDNRTIGGKQIIVAYDGNKGYRLPSKDNGEPLSGIVVDMEAMGVRYRIKARDLLVAWITAWIQRSLRIGTIRISSDQCFESSLPDMR
jgi:hypothetical protein